MFSKMWMFAIAVLWLTFTKVSAVKCGRCECIQSKMNCRGMIFKNPNPIFVPNSGRLQSMDLRGTRFSELNITIIHSEYPSITKIDIPGLGLCQLDMDTNGNITILLEGNHPVIALDQAR